MLQKKLARFYSAEGYPVVRVSLASIAVRMRTKGSSFAESLFELGLSSFDVPPVEVVNAGIAVGYCFAMALISAVLIRRT